MVLDLDRMCQRGLHSVLWSPLPKVLWSLMHRLAAEPCSTAGFLFHSRCPSGTILLTPYRWCGTGRFQEQGQCFFIGQSCSIQLYSSTPFPFLFFLSVGWCCGAGVFGLIVIIIIIIIIRKGRQCKAGRERLTPYQSEDPNPTTPTHRMKEERGKTVGDKK